MLLEVLLIGHFVGDFLLQSREIATNKSSSWKHLGQHILLLWTGMYLVVAPYGYYNGIDMIKVKLLLLINCLIHGVIDKFIWNLYKLIIYIRLCYRYRNISKNGRDFMINLAGERIIKEKTWADDSTFYSIIGLDQLLHALTIIWLYRWLL